MFIRVITLTVCLIASAFPAMDQPNAQTIATPGQTALGGGTAFNTGMSAHFNNPANLMIRQDHRRHQVTAGTGGFYYSTGGPLRNPLRLYGDLLPYFVPDDPTVPVELAPAARDRMFHGTDRYHQTQSYEIIPVGYTWTGKNRAYSLALRSRGIGSFEMNRNWYSEDHPGEDADVAFVRFLNENYQVYHEASFAFAREVTVVNQWHSGLNTLYIGLAPKILFGGMYSQIRYRSEYQPDGGNWLNTETMKVLAAGDMSAYLKELQFSDNAMMASRNHLGPSSNTNTSGIGIGLDAGLTYIIPLGDDTSLSPYSTEPLSKSLRFSIALTDLGAIRYARNPGEWQSRNVIRPRDDISENSVRYDGKPGELLRYLHDNSFASNVFNNLDRTDESAFTIQLPTEFHAGAAVQYRWFVSMIDLNYRFNSPDFRTDGWRLSLASEVRLLGVLPLSGSVQLNPGGSAAIGVGAGLDLGYFRFSGAVRFFRTDEVSPEWRVNSISGLALQVRF
jgi:hypothetical protein